MSARRSFAWAVSGQLLNFIVSFAASVVIARLLTPRELGIYAIALAILGAVQFLTSFGISAYLVRERALTAQMLASAFTINALLSVALAGALFILGGAGSWLGDPGAGDVLRVLALTPLIGIPAFRPAAMAQREQRFRLIALVTVASSLTAALVTVGLALRGNSYMSLAYGALASSVVSTAAYLLFARGHFSLRVSLSGWRAIAGFGVQMMSIGGVAVLGTRLGEIVIGRVLGVAALGLYARASGLAGLIFDNVYGTMTRVLFANMAEEQRRTGVLRDKYVRGLQLVTAVMWPALIGLAVLAGPVIRLLYGERWLAAATPLALMMIAQFMVLCVGMQWELFVLRGETARQARLEIGRSTVSLAATAIGSQFGLAGAAAGRLVDASAVILLYRPHVDRLSGAAPGEIARVLIPNMLLTLCAVAPAFLLMAANGWSPAVPLFEVLGAIGLGAALWLAAIALTGHPLLDEARLLRRTMGANWHRA